MKKIIGEYEKSSILLFMMMMFANFCSYLFQIATGSILSVEEYGMLNTLISLISIITAAASVLLSITTRMTAEINLEYDAEKANKVINLLINITLVMEIVFLVVCIPLTNIISRALNIPNKKYVVIAIFISVIVLMSYTSSGIVQGLQWYKNYGIQEVMLNLGKLILAFLFSFMGFDLYGILLALGVSYILKIIYFLYALKGVCHFKVLPLKEDLSQVKQWDWYILGTIVVRIAIIVLMNADTLLVKALFSDTETGVYSSGMVIAKIGMYLATTLVVPLFPMVVKNKAVGKNIKSIFMKALIYGAGSAAIYGAVLVSIGGPVINILFGERYAEVIPLFRQICPYVLWLTCLIVIMNYVLANDAIKFFAVTIVSGMLLMFVLVQRYHNSISVMLRIMNVIMGCVVVVNLIHILSERKDKKRNYRREGVEEKSNAE